MDQQNHVAVDGRPFYLSRCAGVRHRKQSHPATSIMTSESSEILLEAYGIVTRDNSSVDLLSPKTCPNCNEGNTYDAKFCVKCRIVLTYDAYNKTLQQQQEKELEIQRLREKYEQDMKVMREDMQKLVLEADQSDQIKIMREQITKLQDEQAKQQKSFLATGLRDQKLRELDYITNDDERRKRLNQLIKDGIFADPEGFYDEYMKKMEKRQRLNQ